MQVRFLGLALRPFQTNIILKSKKVFRPNQRNEKST